MKKKPVWRPKEKAHQRLLQHINERIDGIHLRLRTLYFGEQNCTTADIIHEVRKEVSYLRSIFCDLLLDQTPAEKILADLKERRRDNE